MSQGVMQTNKTKFFVAFVVAVFFVFVLFAVKFFFGVFTTKFVNTVHPGIVAVHTNVVDNDIVLAAGNNVATEVRV